MGRLPPRCSRSRSRSLSFPFSASPFSAWVMLPAGQRRRAEAAPARAGPGVGAGRKRAGSRSAPPLRQVPSAGRGGRGFALVPGCGPGLCTGRGAAETWEPGERRPCGRAEPAAAKPHQLGWCCWWGWKQGSTGIPIENTV